MKLCKDCKWCVNIEVPKCINPKLGLSPVDGSVAWVYCYSERVQRITGPRLCGPDGNWYEQKEPDHRA